MNHECSHRTFKIPIASFKYSIPEKVLRKKFLPNPVRLKPKKKGKNNVIKTREKIFRNAWLVQ